MLGGLVAGEGSFVICGRGCDFVATGSPRLRFVFQVQMASRDRALLEQLQAFLGAGSIYDSPPRKSHWQPNSTFAIRSLDTHRTTTIPFADEYLLPCAKRRQFDSWRAALEAYDRDRPVRVKGVCSVEGCGKPIRGRGLCRSHYYRVTGH
jgi:LAGLIDADG endonuclease